VAISSADARTITASRSQLLQLQLRLRPPRRLRLPQQQQRLRLRLQQCQKTTARTMTIAETQMMTVRPERSSVAARITTVPRFQLQPLQPRQLQLQQLLRLNQQRRPCHQQFVTTPKTAPQCLQISVLRAAAALVAKESADQSPQLLQLATARPGQQRRHPSRLPLLQT
jgi:hypothetical protein